MVIICSCAVSSCEKVIYFSILFEVFSYFFIEVGFKNLYIIFFVVAFMNPELKRKLLIAQKSEITEHFIYKMLANSVRDEDNKRVLSEISGDELSHYETWKKYTGEEIKPSRFNIFFYYVVSKIFGLTFGLRLMEKSEERAGVNYEKISEEIIEAREIVREENEHEEKLIRLLNEEKLKYVGSIVLGLNDALVELTGALAGLTFALQDSQLIAMAGLVTGIAASLSMGASEYLSTRSEEGSKENEGKHPVKASIYTGIAYLITVSFLIFPYLVIGNLYGSLVWMMANAVIIIFLFTFYVSVARDVDFKKEFWSMALISLGVAVISFGIGYLVRWVFGAGV